MATQADVLCAVGQDGCDRFALCVDCLLHGLAVNWCKLKRGYCQMMKWVGGVMRCVISGCPLRRE